MFRVRLTASALTLLYLTLPVLSMTGCGYHVDFDSKVDTNKHTGINTAANIAIPASSDWGLSFQNTGRTLFGNGSSGGC